MIAEEKPSEYTAALYKATASLMYETFRICLVWLFYFFINGNAIKNSMSIFLFERGPDIYF